MKAVAALLLALASTAAAAVAPSAPITCDAVWRDPARGRDLPVRIRLPGGRGKVPLVLWSPGLGGDTHGGAVWARAWVEAGMAVISLQHPGSDSEVYSEAKGPEDQKARVRAAATPVQLLARVGDVGFVLDELARRPREGACDLTRIDPERIGMAGHSMGAWTVQALAGQRFGIGTVTDRRPRAFVAMSGTMLEPGDPAASFGGVGRPYLAITGTLDGTPSVLERVERETALALRTAPWRGMPADGRKYLLVFAGADHMMFAGNRTGPDALTGHVAATVLAVTTAFWQRWLKEERQADAVLAKPALAAGDMWQRK